jgi:LuxR family maltose regulon positive regulatory protein
VTLEALAELIAVHARAGHVKSSVGLLPRAMAAHAAALQQNPKTLPPLLDLRLHLCRAYACIASQEFRQAQHHLDALASLAATLRCGREDVECKLLQALVMHRLGKDTRELLRETTHLADVLGLKRIAIDTHPGLLSLLPLPPSLPAVQAGDAPFARRDPASQVRREMTVAPTELLTPKEREILGLMSQGLQNKEIATASGVGQETVKWHIKNLFAKMGAANRRHAVARARMFGLLAAED